MLSVSFHDFHVISLIKKQPIAAWFGVTICELQVVFELDRHHNQGGV